MDLAGEHVDGVIGRCIIDVISIAAMGDASDDDSADVEPEAERQHEGDGSAAFGQ